MRLPRPSEIEEKGRQTFTLVKRGPSVELEQLVERENNLLQLVVARIMAVRPRWLSRFGIPRNVKLSNLARFELWDDGHPDRPGQYLYRRPCDSRKWALADVEDIDGELYAVFGKGAFYAKVTDLDGLWARTPDVPE